MPNLSEIASFFLVPLFISVSLIAYMCAIRAFAAIATAVFIGALWLLVAFATLSSGLGFILFLLAPYPILITLLMGLVVARLANGHWGGQTEVQRGPLFRSSVFDPLA